MDSSVHGMPEERISKLEDRLIEMEIKTLKKNRERKNCEKISKHIHCTKFEQQKQTKERVMSI